MSGNKRYDMTIFLLVLVQSLMMMFGQICLKLAMKEIDFSWTWACIGHQVLPNMWLWAAVVLLVAANLFWLWLLKEYPFSIIYPLTSLGFVFGMVSGVMVLHETVNPMQWVGVVMVLAGCFFIANK